MVLKFPIVRKEFTDMLIISIESYRNRGIYEQF